jgi:beta-glucanase (GH16 family)
MLDDAATLGEPYASGEHRSNGYFGYGCYEASFKPVLVPGVVTSFFTFAGPYDNGGNGQHNEIDVEFLGNQPGRAQLNFWTDDDSYGSRNEVLIDLGYDPAAAYHRYGFKWTSRSIEWYVDGKRVYTAVDQASSPTPKGRSRCRRSW